VAVREGEYLLLQQGGRLFLLLGKAGKHHLVSVDRRLTQEKEEKLLQMYPCSEEALRELEITVSVLNVRGYAADDCEAGDDLVLYVGKKRHRYTLSDDSSPEAMDAIFSGVERFPMQKKKYKPNQWRLAAQKKELVPVMKGVKPVLLVLSWASVAGLMLHHPLWSILGILVTVSCGILDLVLPQYFTLLDFGKGEKDEHAIGLAFPACLPMLVQAMYVFVRFNFLSLEIFLWSVGIAVAVCVVFGVWCREFAERTGDLLALLLLLAMFLAGPIGMVNGLTDRGPEDVYPVKVEDMHTSSGKNTSYFCTVTLKNGEEFDLEVSKGDYESIAVGQTIVIALHEGGLGIEYISLVEP